MEQAGKLPGYDSRMGWWGRPSRQLCAPDADVLQRPLDLITPAGQDDERSDREDASGQDVGRLRKRLLQQQRDLQRQRRSELHV
jgi:hypothetical protein